MVPLLRIYSIRQKFNINYWNLRGRNKVTTDRCIEFWRNNAISRKIFINSLIFSVTTYTGKNTDDKITVNAKKKEIDDFEILVYWWVSRVSSISHSINKSIINVIRFRMKINKSITLHSGHITGQAASLAKLFQNKNYRLRLLRRCQMRWKDEIRLHILRYKNIS